jgi:hypothetical protein
MRHKFLGSAPVLVAMCAGILAAGTACSSDSGTGGNTPSIKLTLHPVSASVDPGGSVPVTGVLTRTDFTGDVSITADGFPSGVTYIVTAPATNGSDSTTISLIVGSSTSAGGPYTIQVHASGTGVTTSTAAFALTVPSGGPDTISEARRH